MSYITYPTENFIKDSTLVRKGIYNRVVESINKNNWIPEYEIEYKKKCCDNCIYFDEDCCDEDVSNVYAENLIKDSDTFYCSYHKFKV